MAIAVLGSINMDVTAYLPRLPNPGETLHGPDYRLGLGGKGANQAVAARKLGSEVGFVCRLGDDDLGRLALRELASHGVDTSLAWQDPEGTTGIAIINVGEGGENAISVIGGSNLTMDQSDIERGRIVLERAHVLLLQMEVPISVSLQAAAIARLHGGVVLLDPAPAPKEGLPIDILTSVDIITPNETEAGMILGWRPETLDEGLRAARELRARGVTTAVVKLGARGVAVASAGFEEVMPAFAVNAIDTVAAGDSFNGGLAHALERKTPLKEAIRFASACGALSTTKKGASAAAPTRPEVEAYLARI